MDKRGHGRPPEEPRPGVAPATGPSGATFTLEVDGEFFAVTSGQEGSNSFHYAWLSGPNDGYGFGSSGPGPPRSLEEHRDSIRGFLSMVDPGTGYIEDA